MNKQELEHKELKKIFLELGPLLNPKDKSPFIKEAINIFFAIPGGDIDSFNKLKKIIDIWKPENATKLYKSLENTLGVIIVGLKQGSEWKEIIKDRFEPFIKDYDIEIETSFLDDDKYYSHYSDYKPNVINPTSALIHDPSIKQLIQLASVCTIESFKEIDDDMLLNYLVEYLNLSTLRNMNLEEVTPNE